MLTFMLLGLIAAGVYKAVKSAGAAATNAPTVGGPLGWLAKIIKK